MSRKNRSDFKDQIIDRKNDQIDFLKKKIEELEISNDEKDDIISSIEEYRKDLSDSVAELRKCREEYNRLADELHQMRRVIDETVFNGKWKFIKWLAK